MNNKMYEKKEKANWKKPIDQNGRREPKIKVTQKNVMYSMRILNDEFLRNDNFLPR